MTATADAEAAANELMPLAEYLGSVLRRLRALPPLDLDLRPLPSGAIVYDLVYAPLRTDLLAQADDLGLEPVDGLEMLVAQAALAFELHWGREPPRERDDELRELLLA